VGWPEKLITQAEAFAGAAHWPIYVASSTYPATDDMSLYCDKPRDNPEPGQWKTCRQAIGQLRRGATTYNGSLDEMLSMVLRHMVMAHDVPLAGLRAQDNAPPAGSTHG
jgi:hypothetical protein